MFDKDNIGQLIFAVKREEQLTDITVNSTSCLLLAPNTSVRFLPSNG